MDDMYFCWTASNSCLGREYNCGVPDWRGFGHLCGLSIYVMILFHSHAFHLLVTYFTSSFNLFAHDLFDQTLSCMYFIIFLLIILLSNSISFYLLLIWLLFHSSTCINTCCFPVLYFSLFLLKYSNKSFLVPPGLPYWKVCELPMYLLYQSTYIHYNQFFINKAAHTLCPPQHSCMSNNCNKSCNRQRLIKAEQWERVLYTLHNSTLSVCSTMCTCIAKGLLRE